MGPAHRQLGLFSLGEGRGDLAAALTVTFPCDAGTGTGPAGLPAAEAHYPDTGALALGVLLAFIAWPSAALAPVIAMLAMMPAGMALDPEQLAMMQDAQTALANPLSPPETVATIDELAELGFLPAEFQAELKECMVLVPASVPALGMSMGMFKPMVPQLREARDQMRALSPAEQDELAGAMAEELQAVSTDDRKVFIESLDGGFFPPRVSEGVKVRLGAE